ncbi:MAG: 4-hydroxy-3-methylbut-2-enyl diphosphate reductase, partial [Muribaculaceae bacterium]|nr:4-hydroxy-3-methylbut-2-enyl diphosphate reductase [Muribaculaceae bacterium]
MMNIEIDSESGFCFGVVTAIRKAEEELEKSGSLYCLGDIVHNSDEVQRLADKGLTVITHEDLQRLHGVKVLLRAHGEPPSTYGHARANGIEIIDATCPVVLRLQQRIKECYDRSGSERPQIVIYGKKGHAEVNGLVGQTDGEAIVVENIAELDRLAFTRPIALYS